MSIEDRLRRAIEARTSSVEPSQDALGRITDKLSDQRDPMDLSSTRARLIIGIAAAVVLIAAVAAGLLLPGGSDRTETEGIDTADSMTTTEDETTSTEANDSSSSTSSTTAQPPATSSTRPSGPGLHDEAQILWPRPSSEVRFDTPDAVARSFAVYYARFADPIVGAFRQGDSRSGEVPVQAFPDGPETTVRVRQLDGDGWFVIGAQSENITVSIPSPRPGHAVVLTCPQNVTGTALAFEGTVQVRIDAFQADGDRVELGQGFVTGSGSPPAGPYEGDIACRHPQTQDDVEDYVILALWEESAEDGGGTLGMTAVPLALRE